MGTKQEKGCYWCAERKKMLCKARNLPIMNGVGTEHGLKALGSAVGGGCTRFKSKSKTDCEKVLFT